MIAYGIKDVENRTWKTPWRGRFLIHASGLDMIDIMNKYYPTKVLNLVSNYFDILENQNNPDKAKELLQEYPFMDKMDILDDVIDAYKNRQEIYLKKQAIIGSVELIDIVQNSKSLFAETGCYHWILKDAVLFDKPIFDVKGKLNLWEYDYESKKI